jgi:hypothetical protein
MINAILVSIGKGRHEKEGRDVHENIDVDSVEIESMPKFGDIFEVIKKTTLHQKYMCLRVSSGDEGIEHYSGVVFAEFLPSDTRRR